MIGALVGLVLVVYLAACLVVGFGPVGTLDDFQPAYASPVRRFTQSPREVATAYVLGARQTPGATVAETHGRQMLVDLKPTSRILGGNFGSAIRIGFEADGAGTVVRTESKNKVPFAIVANHRAALDHAERALRMQAKRLGHLDEVIVGVDV